MSDLLKIKINVEKAEPIRNQPAIIGDIEARHGDDGSLRLSVPLTYPADAPPEFQRTIFGSIYFKQEDHLSLGNDDAKQYFPPDSKELTGWRINKSRLDQLFVAAGFAQGAELGELTGKTISFSAKARKDQPNQLEVSGYYPSRG